MAQNIISVRLQRVLYDKKWKKFLKRAWLFRHIPFVEFVLGAGSLATGAVNDDSDFDVIVCAKTGRIFSARLFSILFFGVFGWRRKRLSHKGAGKDMVCLNHFITRKTFRLSPPHSDSWRTLYANLVPVFGDQKPIDEFFKANSNWLCANIVNGDDMRHRYKKSSALKIAGEIALRGYLGSYLERALKFFQIKKIERSLKKDPAGFRPRIVYNDFELEFHPDRAKFEV